MAIEYESQTWVSCDSCEQRVASSDNQKTIFAALRAEGWKIGKRVTCPDCVERFKREYENERKVRRGGGEK